MKTKGGRPTKYDPRIHPEIARCASRMGGSLDRVAQECGVSLSTVQLWVKAFPKFSVALREGKEFADGKVVNAIFRRAVGYEYEETEVIETKTSGTTTDARYRTTKKRVAPDVDAAKFWLTNRQPAMWSNRKELTGANGGPIETKTTTEVKHTIDWDALKNDLARLDTERAMRGAATNGDGQSVRSDNADAATVPLPGERN